MKNTFNFTLKFIFILKIFKFMPWLFRLIEKRLDWKAKINSKIYDVTTWLTIAMYILPNISRNKGNHTMKFSQLIAHHMRNVFDKNHTKNVVEKIFPNPFLKKRNWAHLWINSLKFYTVCCYYMLSWGLSKHIKFKLHTTCFYLI